MKKIMVMMTTVMVMAAVHPALASDETRKVHGKHMHGPLHGDKKQTESMHGDTGTMKNGTFLVKKEIDGFTVSFHVMQAQAGMQYGGSHNLMVKVERDGKLADIVAVNSKVKHPNDQEESKMMVKMGDWFMAGYDLGHEGRHQLMVLFKTTDGEKHFVGIWYPEE